MECDALLVFGVEYLEGLEHIFFAGDGQHHPKTMEERILGHEGGELTIVDDAVAVCVDLADQFVDLLFG